jgi:hypothetical protein
MKKHMTVTKTIGAVIMAAGLTSCCLRKVTITPEMSTVDLKAATAGNFKAVIEIVFKDCCPSKQQKALALQLQSGVAALYMKLLAGEVKLEYYNQMVKAARESIETVVLVCNATKSGGQGIIAFVPEYGISLEQAWQRVHDVNQQLK